MLVSPAVLHLGMCPHQPCTLYAKFSSRCTIILKDKLASQQCDCHVIISFVGLVAEPAGAGVRAQKICERPKVVVTVCVCCSVGCVGACGDFQETDLVIVVFRLVVL